MKGFSYASYSSVTHLLQGRALLKHYLAHNLAQVVSF